MQKSAEFIIESEDGNQELFECNVYYNTGMISTSVDLDIAYPISKIIIEVDGSSMEISTRNLNFPELTTNELEEFKAITNYQNRLKITI
jgi:hypothetical protein